MSVPRMRFEVRQSTRQRSVYENFPRNLLCWSIAELFGGRLTLPADMLQTCVEGKRHAFLSSVGWVRPVDRQPSR